MAATWDEQNDAVNDLALLMSLASRFDPRIVQPDELARTAFYRISQLLDALSKKEAARACAYREGQKEMSDHAIYLMQYGERDVPTLVRGLLENFGLMDEPEASEPTA